MYEPKYEIKSEYGHYIVLKDGKFIGSADNYTEAQEIIREDEEEK